MFQEIKASLHELYLEDERPWLVGFSGGKDSTMLASLIFDVAPDSWLLTAGFPGYGFAAFARSLGWTTWIPGYRVKSGPL
jgi:hypothetical protein